MAKAYVIELIRRGGDPLTPRVIESSEPDAENATVAIKAAQKIFKSRGSKSGANGFRVKEREGGKIVTTWYADNLR